MRLFKESNKYNYRQTFIGMIQSIFCDFCQVKPLSDKNLIEMILVNHFSNDIIDLSKDKVVNVRLCLAEAFYYLHKTLDKLEVKGINSKSASKQVQDLISQKSTLIQYYLNKNFFVAIKNLKYDPSECVSELLINYNVLTAED